MNTKKITKIVFKNFLFLFVMIHDCKISIEDKKKIIKKLIKKRNEEVSFELVEFAPVCKFQQLWCEEICDVQGWEIS